jgi:hypothetical protein
MTIQEYLNSLEEIKNKLISLQVPLDTKMVNTPDMGFCRPYFLKKVR